jgi:IclR family KDG regulon transcriptional repressor
LAKTKKTGDDADEKQSGAVARTIAILEILASHKSINLEQLARETSLPKATLLRFLSSLVSLGYVSRDQYDLYSLTLRMFSVGSHSLEHMDLVGAAKPEAESLEERFGETVHVGILEDDTAVYVLKVESRYNIRMHSRVGKSIPLYCTAIGKALLANLPSSERKTLLRKIRMVPFTPNTLKNVAALEAELGDIRKNGWSMDREEHETGVTCTAAPVRDYSGRVVAAISVSWPLFRYDAAHAADYEKAVSAAADRISLSLGYIRQA